MATKTKLHTKKTKKTSFIPPLFKDERFRFILGLSLSLFTIYLALAFISFFFTGGADQSKLDLNWFNLMRDSSIRVENWTGKKGAFLANLLINKGFGIASFSFLYMLLILSFYFWGFKLPSLKKSLFYTLLFSIWFSVATAFVFIDSSSDSFLFLGGVHGFFISEWLIASIGNVGTAFLLIASLLCFLIFCFQNTMVVLKKIAKKEQSNEKDFENEEKAKLANADSELNQEQEENTEMKTKELVLTTNLDLRQQEATTENNNDIELKIETAKKTEETSEPLQESLEDFDPTLDLSRYQFPPIALLEDHHANQSAVGTDELESNKNRIVETLRHYKIEIVKIKATIGPTVTLYEIVPAPGVRISKIKNLEDDIALSLSALGIRIIAPIPGKGTIGIEVPNRSPEIVSMKGIIASKKFQESKFALPVALGRTISNETYTLDLAKMPHLLVAGATGQGKSVGLNAIITSLLYKKHPAQLKFVLIDPKKVELNIYATIEKHFLAKLPDEEEPIITDIHKVIATLNSLCIEMDTRYDLLKKAHARNLKEYNAKFVKRKLNPENGHRYLPYIVVIIDEFADLIMTAGKEIETPIARIAQLARAIGIHMIIATQRPSTNIITGVIKANFPARIAFKVASMIDSRTILDSPGANQLIGRGDMLISIGSDLVRVQCAFVDTPEVENITKFIGEQQGYPSALMLPEYVGEPEEMMSGEVDLQKKDALFEEAARLVVTSQQGSTSGIQRRFSIGYNRAGRIVDQLEAAGIVGPFEGSKARQVLIQDEYSLEQLLNNL